MAKPGLRKLRCKKCGASRELEMGIRTMFCCAQEMVEVKEEEEQAPTLKLKSRQ